MRVDNFAKPLIALILPLLLAMAPVSAFGRESADLAPRLASLHVPEIPPRSLAMSLLRSKR